MEDESIMELDTFILYNIILSIFFYTIYTQCIFRNINGLNESGSKKIMIIIVFISLVVGIIFEQNRMNNRYAIINSSTPLGIYTAISYMPYRRYNILAFLISAIIITIVIMIIIFARKIKKRQYYKKILKLRFNCAIKVLQNVFGITFIIMIIFVGYQMHTVQDMHKTDKSVELLDTSKTFEEVISSNMEYILKFDENIWVNLSMQEKLDALKVVAEIEAHKFGLPYKLNVKIECLSDGVGGYYKYSSKTIFLDEECVENINGTEILSMLCHEAWHSYEFALRDAYNVARELKSLKLYKEAKEYDYGLDNYISLEEDKERYTNQKVEVDSREYADKTSKEYFEIIENYNKQ